MRIGDWRVDRIEEMCGPTCDLSIMLPVWDALSVGADDVDNVVWSDFNVEHVGGTTIAAGERWVPAFPPPLHFVGNAGWDDVREKSSVVEPGEDAQLIYADSIVPVVQAGLWRLVALPCDEAPGLTLEAASGWASLEDAAWRGTFLLPTHFGHVGPFRVRRMEDGFEPSFLGSTVKAETAS